MLLSREALSAGILSGAVLDVWEAEPETDRRLVELSDIATPHIAGYSVDGKANATVNSVRQVASVLGIPLADWTPASLPRPAEPVIDITGRAYDESTPEIVARAVRHTYPVDEDDRLFRADLGKFEYLRDNYRIRREFGSYRVKTADPEAEQILAALGFKIVK